MTQVLPTTKFTCYAPAVRSSSVLGHSAPKIADKAQAGRLFCALPRGATGTKMGCGEDAATHFRQVNSTLCEKFAIIF